VANSLQLELVPLLSQLTLSVVAGTPPIDVVFRGLTTRVPAVETVLFNAQIPVSVVSPQNGENFLSWSDGLPQAHSFVVPRVATSTLGVSFGFATTAGSTVPLVKPFGKLRVLCTLTCSRSQRLLKCFLLVVF
jgi:hypothetical protein